MATFPSLIPSEAPITPGAWPTTPHLSLNGAEARIRHGSAQIGARWSPSFVNITEADFLAILNHYRGQRSGFDSFGFSTTTLAADRTPAGFAWLYAGPPEVVDQHVDCFTVQCQFRCEPRGLVVAQGKAWRTPTTTFRPPGDPYFSSVWLLLHMDGGNGSTTFPDSSSHGFTVTASGNAQVSTTDPKFGSGSLTLDGTGDCLKTTVTGLGFIQTQDFTAECWAWINPGNTGVDCLFGFELSTFKGPCVLIDNGNWDLRYANTNSGSMGAVTTGAWQHVALSRSGSSLRFFINGNQLGSTLTDTMFYEDNGISVGSAFGMGDFISAKVDEFRVTVGVARYIANFTPPSAPFPNA